MTFENLFISDKDFEASVQEVIRPFLRERANDGYFVNTDGLSLHYKYLINPDERASIVISHGFCEYIPKYEETVYYFYKMGYSVFIMEHRGHGFSEREVDNLSKVYVKHFEDYVYDFNQFVEKIVATKSKSGHLYLFAHSMGGGIGAMYLEKYPNVFEKAVLTSPMIEIATPTTNAFVIKLVCLLSHLRIFAKSFLPKHHDYDHTYKYPQCSAMSKARYNSQYNQREEEPHYRTNGATFAWTREAVNVSKKILKNAHLIEIPVILMQASKDTLVMPQAQVKFSRLAKNCTLRIFEGSKHEIFNATDDIIKEYYKEVFSFFENRSCEE
jgi:lysophospholipase